MSQYMQNLIGGSDCINTNDDIFTDFIVVFLIDIFTGWLNTAYLQQN